MFGIFKRSAPPIETPRPKNPHLGRSASRSFFSDDASRLMPGWVTQSVSIDQYLREQLTTIRARARELARKNPHARRYTMLMRTNIAGPKGVGVEPQVMRAAGNGRESKPDDLANDSISAAFADWAENHADFEGVLSWADMQSMAISSHPSDGEFIFEEITGKEAGKYGYQLRQIDPELLDVSRNQLEANGNLTRLGVERDKRGRPVRYWLRELDAYGNYGSGRVYSIDAERIIHCFLPEYPNQSRGIPWMTTGIERMKMLDGYEQAALVAARAGAAKMGFFSSKEGSDYEGDEGDEDGPTITAASPGTFEDIGAREFHAYDPKYPHEQYSPFTEANLHAVSAGWGVSFASLSNNLKGVNYSSIRAGVMDDRELFKLLQEWFIRCFISRVYKNWLKFALMRGAIKFGNTPLSRAYEDYLPVKFQPKRWAWVDPLKDMQANKMGCEMGVTSPIDVMLDQGHDPEKVLSNWRKFTLLVEKYGLEKYLGVGAQAQLKPQQPKTPDPEDDNEEEG